ncbi:unnamed protein product [Nezara viridula]|uniref:C3H1-type domain-containing protein n=1 Tax=Nezara viridula TaxID=85310 RepID=A0A9P0E1C6_NEZVI|nr:unnamed protein product [Nezara viridula]
MDLPTDVEEILSDDYEEGEILDGDNLYDEVSSLEEFSSGDEESSQLQNSNKEADKRDSVIEKLKQSTKHRRKDHKCKENSVCRKERKGKHCYARIRKAKSSNKHKTISEVTTQSTVERVFPRKPDPVPVVKHLKCRPVSPYKVRPDPAPKILHRFDYKDYHEKENRHNNKRFWSNPPRNKLKPPEKNVHYHRNKLNKDNHYKSNYKTPTPPPPKVASVEIPKTETISNDNSFSKTSLLKRLVGSGTTGVKPIKENESSLFQPKPENIDSDVIPVCKLNEHLEASSEGNHQMENTVTPDEKSDDYEKTEMLSEQPKKIEVKWIRSMKEDKDELHLRVEALRSAWVKKFNDRKKKGLIYQKKSDESDDFLEEFVLGSDIEDEKNDDTVILKTNDNTAKSNAVHCFNATDISGDILKPEDMVIVNDKPTEEAIISETAVARTEGNSSVFVDPLFFSVGQYPQKTNICQVSNSNSNLSSNNLITTAVASSDTLLKNKWENSVNYKNIKLKQTPLDQKLTENYQYSISSHKSKTRRSRWKKRRRSKGNMIDTTKNINASNTSADLDENELRELALLSVKQKNKSKISATVNDVDTNENNPQIIENGVIHISNKPTDKVIASLCESESTGAGSGDNWEDDLDEDILRAKLLSSLTKQVSEESAKIESLTAGVLEPISKERIINTRIFKPVVNLINEHNSKKQVIKKIDKRKLRNSLNKKVWKQGIAPVRKARQEALISINHFRKPKVFQKSDSSKQIQLNNASNVRPIPQVAQMIIKLDDSDSSSDLDNSTSEPVKSLSKLDLVPPEIEANIDLLLREAELNSQLEKGVIDSSSISKQLDNEEKKQEIKRPNVETHGSSSSSSSSSCSSVKTPQVLKHLPAWQQEEYKRLKKKIAEKEKVLQVTRSKIIEPSKDTNICNIVSSDVKDSAISALMPIMSTDNTISLNNLSNSSIIAENSSGPFITTLETVSKNIDAVDKPIKVENSSSPSDIFDTSKSSLNKPPPKIDKACPVENSIAKKSFPNLVSCTIMEEINLMNDIVNDFDKNNTEYVDLKQKTARLKRILKATESKMAVKKKAMFQIRDTLTEKERQISSKIGLMASSTQPDKNRLQSRDMEIVKLKYKEVTLRAQVLFHNFLSEKIVTNNNDKKSVGNVGKLEFSPTGIKRTLSPKETTTLKKKFIVKDSVVAKNVLPQDKAKDSNEVPLKRNFSGKEREREEWDPNTPVCHYDLHGICRDEECQYQHFKTV